MVHTVQNQLLDVPDYWFPKHDTDSSDNPHLNVINDLHIGYYEEADYGTADAWDGTGTGVDVETTFPTTPSSGKWLIRQNTNGASGLVRIYTYDGAAWVYNEYGAGGGVTDHGALTGLLDDDHTQYAKLAGDTFVGDVIFDAGIFGNLDYSNATENTAKRSIANYPIQVPVTYVDDYFFPIIAQSLSTSSTKAHVGIWALYDGSAGSYLKFGTSNSFATGITNTAITINPSGNVDFSAGIDVSGQITSSSDILIDGATAEHADYKTLNFATGGMMGRSGSGDMYIYSNMYLDAAGAWKAITTDQGCYIRVYEDQIGFFFADSVSAGATFGAFTETFRSSKTTVTSLVNHDFSAGVDVTGNITVTGLVDGVDIAARDHAIFSPALVTAHSDVSNAGSGIIISAAERTKLDLLDLAGILATGSYVQKINTQAGQMAEISVAVEADSGTYVGATGSQQIRFAIRPPEWLERYCEAQGKTLTVTTTDMKWKNNTFADYISRVIVYHRIYDAATPTNSDHTGLTFGQSSTGQRNADTINHTNWVMTMGDALHWRIFVEQTVSASCRFTGFDVTYTIT